MRRYGPWLAAALVVLSNLAAWRVAALNRSGEPEAVLVLTEREVRLPAKQTENTALGVSLVFEPPRSRTGVDPPPEAGWFDRAKLQAIGFDCSRPVTEANASYYRTRLPRTVFVALEYEGALWLQQVDRARRETEARDPLLDSHLVPVDADRSAGALRARHPDRRRVAIVEATAAVQFVSPPGRAPFLMGRVTSVLPPEINVPREWRRLLEGLQTDARPGTWPPPQHEPRFRATVAWGTRLEPWITNVELLTPQPVR